jgi:hypothetical protein
MTISNQGDLNQIVIKNEKQSTRIANRKKANSSGDYQVALYAPFLSTISTQGKSKPIFPTKGN